jgi:ribonuclease P protein component
MAAGYWLPDARRAVRNLPFLTRRPSSTNNPASPAEGYLCAMGNFRFPKEERLTKKKVIEDLFKQGTSFSAFPLKVIFSLRQDSPSAKNQVLVTVPSRTFKKATDRNTLKRRIREGYRLNKALLTPPFTFSLAYIYIAKEILPSPAIHQAIQSSLRRLSLYESKT